MEIYCKVTALGLVPLYDSDYEDKKNCARVMLLNAKYLAHAIISFIKSSSHLFGLLSRTCLKPSATHLI